MRVYLQIPAVENQVARFYQIMIQPDLLQGWNVIRESGQQGSRGRVTTEHYATYEEAQTALERLRDRQLARGFQVVFVKGLESPP